MSIGFLKYQPALLLSLINEITPALCGKQVPTVFFCLPLIREPENTILALLGVSAIDKSLAKLDPRQASIIYKATPNASALFSICASARNPEAWKVLARNTTLNYQYRVEIPRQIQHTYTSKNTKPVCTPLSTHLRGLLGSHDTTCLGRQQLLAIRCAGL